MSKKKKLPIKSVEKSVNAWLKRYPELGQQILELAEMQGALVKGKTIGGEYKLSTAKSKQKKVESFINSFKHEYGTVTSFEKRQKEKYRQTYSREEQRERGKRDFKRFATIQKKYSSLVKELFAFFPSNEVARPFLDYVETMDKEQATRELEDFIKNAEKGSTSAIEKYKQEYGEEPPF